ncbi:MAG: hypothetical protein HYV02_03820 [Deltaproteobacteria bacterium]|nr:hypothetical protein [Deltaproteobacteria bacterium]
MSVHEQRQLAKKYPLLEWYEQYKTAGSVVLRAYELGKRMHFSRIIALAECDILRAADLRKAFEIAGQQPPSAKAYRDKHEMKHYLHACGIPVAAGRRVESALDIFDAAHAYGYPIVIKPIRSTGAQDIHILRTEEALIGFVQQHYAQTFVYEPHLLVEQYIHGRSFHIDGLISGKTVVMIWPSEYLYDPLSVQTEGNPCCSMLLDKKHLLRHPLCDLVTRAITALPSPEHTTSFHAEAFVTDDHSVIFGEIACRTGGAYINTLWSRAFDVNLDAYAARGQAGLVDPIPSLESRLDSLYGGMCIPPRFGKLRHIPRTCPLGYVHEYHPMGEPGRDYTHPTKTTECIASFLFSGSTTHQLKERAREIRRWFHDHVRWSAIAS